MIFHELRNSVSVFLRVLAGSHNCYRLVFSEKDVKKLMTDASIVRNEKKIQATVHNAGEFLKLEKDFSSFQKYLNTFGKDEERMLEAVQERFQHVGPSTARTFLWASGCELTPTREEKKWMAGHKKS